MEKIPIYVPVIKVNTKPPQGVFYWYYKKVNKPKFMTISSPLFPNQLVMVDPRFEDEAIAALMEEALTETTEETKFDVESYIENSNFDW